MMHVSKDTQTVVDTSEKTSFVNLEIAVHIKSMSKEEIIKLKKEVDQLNAEIKELNADDQEKHDIMKVSDLEREGINHK